LLNKVKMEREKSKRNPERNLKGEGTSDAKATYSIARDRERLCGIKKNLRAKRRGMGHRKST